MTAAYILGAGLIAGGGAVGAWLVTLLRQDRLIAEAAETMPDVPLPPALPWPHRHEHVADRAADQIGRPGHRPAHALDSVPADIRSTTAELPVVDRAQVLAWTLGRRRRLGPITARARRVQLELHARLRAAGLRSATGGPRGWLP